MRPGCIFQQCELRIVGIAKLPGYIQAEAGTGRTRGEERLENLVARDFVDSCSVVDDVDFGMGTIVTWHNPYRHGTGCIGGIAQRIVHQVRQDAMEMTAIEADGKAGGNLEPEAVGIPRIA
jgi:hypothetical protein